MCSLLRVRFAHRRSRLVFPAAVSGGVTTAHQVPAVSQSAYSPPTPETPDSIMSTPPQTHLTKSLQPVFSAEHSIPAAPALPPTQPTTKVRTHKVAVCVCAVALCVFADSSPPPQPHLTIPRLLVRFRKKA